MKTKKEQAEEKFKTEGYCSTHGYAWCKCLEAMEKENKYWNSVFNRDKKGKKK